jgi:hypothetical protein
MLVTFRHFKFVAHNARTPSDIADVVSIPLSVFEYVLVQVLSMFSLSSYNNNTTSHKAVAKNVRKKN